MRPVLRLAQLADGLDGILEQVQEGLHELVAIARHRRQRRIVIVDEAHAAAETALGQTAHVVQNVMDIDGLLGERPLVAEHFHAVHEIADALGLGADELAQHPVLVREVLLEKLGCALDAGQRILDLVREHGRHARYRARGRAMRQLALDHLRHVALLQHDRDEMRLLRHRPAIDIDELRRRRPSASPSRRRTRSRSSPSGEPDRRGRARAAEADHFVEPHARQHRGARREECLGRRVRVDDPVALRRERGSDAAGLREEDRTRRAGAGGSEALRRAYCYSCCIHAMHLLKAAAAVECIEPREHGLRPLLGAQPLPPRLDFVLPMSAAGEIPADMFAGVPHAEKLAVVAKHRLDVSARDAPLLGERRHAAIRAVSEVARDAREQPGAP